ncbi:MAG: diacylglycerol kinase family protein [Oscillospiraceae bacterium]
MKNKNKDIKKLAKSFKFAFNGFFYCIKRERNMRIHISAILPVIFILTIVDTDIYSLLFILSAIFFVIFAEMINTAIENIVAKISRSYDFLCKISKDIAAGAVLISAIYAICVALVIFVFSGKWQKILLFIYSNPVWWIIILLYIILAVLFIFYPSFKQNKSKIKEH